MSLQRDRERESSFGTEANMGRRLKRVRCVVAALCVVAGCCCCVVLLAARAPPTPPPLPLPFLQGKAGNAVQYLPRTKAIRKLQLRLSEFRWAGRQRPLPRARGRRLLRRLHAAGCMRAGQPGCCWAQHTACGMHWWPSLTRPGRRAPAPQAAVHPEGHPPARAQEEGARRAQDVLPCQGHQLAHARAAAAGVQVRPRARRGGPDSPGLLQQALRCCCSLRGPLHPLPPAR